MTRIAAVLEGVRAALAGSASDVVGPLLLVLGYTVLALALAVLTFRWDPDAAPLRRGARAAHTGA